MCEDKILNEKYIKNIKLSANLFIMNEIFKDKKSNLLESNIIYKKDDGTESIFYDDKRKDGIQLSRDKYKLSQESIFFNSIFKIDEIEKLSNFTRIDKEVFRGEELLEIQNLNINNWVIYYCLKSLVKECESLKNNDSLNDFGKNIEYIQWIMFEYYRKEIKSEEEKVYNKKCAEIVRNLGEVIRIRKKYSGTKEEVYKYTILLTYALESSCALYKDIECYLKCSIIKQLSRASKQIYMLQLQLFLLNRQRENPSVFIIFNNIEKFLNRDIKFSKKNINRLKKYLKGIDKKIKQIK